MCAMAARFLMTTSALVLLVFGLLHLAYTFQGPKLTPRDPELQQRMKEVSPVISRETTMWNAWVGFNASHSLSVILFGFVYGYLALAHSEFLFRSPALLAIGLGALLFLLVVARLYWFSTPFRGVCVALVCYVASVVLSRWRF